MERQCLEREFLEHEENEQDYLRQEQLVLENIQYLNTTINKDKEKSDICSFFGSMLKNL